MGEHLPYKQGVTGSSPVVPTTKQPISVAFFLQKFRWLDFAKKFDLAIVFFVKKLYNAIVNQKGAKTNESNSP